MGVPQAKGGDLYQGSVQVRLGSIIGQGPRIKAAKKQNLFVAAVVQVSQPESCSPTLDPSIHSGVQE